MDSACVQFCTELEVWYHLLKADLAERETLMIHHIIVAKFKEGTPQQEIAGIVTALRALPPQIPEIRRYQVGLDVVHSARSYDFALVSAFDDLAALERYRMHPEHAPVAQRLQAVSQSMIAVDYET